MSENTPYSELLGQADNTIQELMAERDRLQKPRCDYDGHGHADFIAKIASQAQQLAIKDGELQIYAEREQADKALIGKFQVGVRMQAQKLADLERVWKDEGMTYQMQIAHLKDELSDSNIAFEHANEVVGKLEADLAAAQEELRQRTQDRDDRLKNNLILCDQLAEKERQVAKYAPGDDFRLSAADLNKLINEIPPANDFSDAVKDLLLAHYMLSGMPDLEARNKALEAALQAALDELDAWTHNCAQCDHGRALLAGSKPVQSAEWICPIDCAYCADPDYGHPKPHPDSKLVQPEAPTESNL